MIGASRFTLGSPSGGEYLPIVCRALAIALIVLCVALPGLASERGTTHRSAQPAVCGGTGLCGDANQSGTVTSADIIHMVSWLYLEGPPPIDFDCTDVDDYELVTVRDVFIVAEYVFAGSSAPTCPASQPPLVPTPSINYYIIYADVFPAAATEAQVELTLVAANPLSGLSIPVLIRVDGAVPIIDSIVPSMTGDFTSQYFNINPTGGPAGSAVLNFSKLTGSAVPPGLYPLATIYLSTLPSGSNRPIDITWEDLPPVQNAQLVNYPMLLDDQLDAWEPALVGLTATVTISGTRYYDDQDGDCLLNGEAGRKGRYMLLEPLHFLAITAADGSYSFSGLIEGTYEISAVPKVYWLQSCPPAAGTYTLPVLPGQTVTAVDFGDQVQVDKIDLTVSLAGGRTRPGENTDYTILVSNVGTVSTSATATLTLPDLLDFVSADNGGTYSAGPPRTVDWTLPLLSLPVEGDPMLLHTTLLISNAAQLEDVLNTQVEVVPGAGTDETPADNIAVDRRKVKDSFDPNAKEVTPVGTGSSGWVQRSDTLKYQIYFQNVGNDTAFDVVVRDTLDLDLDITTVASGASSAPYVFSVAGRELIWTFTGIHLPDSIVDEPGSHGFLVYTVRPHAGAPDGASLDNSAGIYFDNNPPVITNTVSNRICPVSLAGDVNGDSVVTSSDIIVLVNFVFKSGAPPLPLTEAGDINCSGEVTSADIIGLVNYVFKGGSPPCDICSVL